MGGVFALAPRGGVWSYSGASRKYAGKLLSRAGGGVRPGEVLATHLHVFNISASF